MEEVIRAAGDPADGYGTIRLMLAHRLVHTLHVQSSIFPNQVLGHLSSESLLTTQLRIIGQYHPNV